MQQKHISTSNLLLVRRLCLLLLSALSLLPKSINLFLYLKSLLQTKMGNTTADNISLISGFYADKSILVTGATGFIGKVS